MREAECYVCGMPLVNGRAFQASGGQIGTKKVLVCDMPECRVAVEREFDSNTMAGRNEQPDYLVYEAPR
jgi:hypothetical protein